MAELRVMAYNILMGGRRRAALAEVVRLARPDVLVVNESPKAIFTWRRRCGQLAQDWSLRYVGGGRDAGSNMLAVAPGIAVSTAVAQVLPTPFFAPRRGIVAAQLSAGGRLFGVVGCHLGLDRRSRAVEVRRVLEVADALSGPVVVAGDLNEPPSGPSWQRLRDAGFRDHGSGEWLTYSARSPRKRIDAVLVRGRVGVLHHGDPQVPRDLLRRASDHRPVLAVLEV